MTGSRARAAALVLAFALALGGCLAPRAAGIPAATKPGWGWRSVPEAARMTVRAVPAAAGPDTPVTRLSKPGWGVRPR